MKCGVTDLVLLVGTNPLPNYVVARYFVKSNSELKRIWLVHSESNETLKEQGTLELAENIRKVLETAKEMYDIRFEMVSIEDISDAKKIKRDIKGKLIKRSCKDASFHLNYTGGTKAMAVHVYRSLETEKNEWCTFSYLDAREFRLKDDEKGYISDDLRKEISISLESLMELHSYEKDPKDKNQGTGKELQALFSQLTIIIKEMIGAGKIQELLKWLKNSQYMDINEPGEVVNEDYVKIRNVVKPILTESGQHQKRLELFLNGKWLEQYTAYVLKKNINGKESLRGNSPLVTTNWKIVKKNNSSKEFELDVIIINGYQICGISCTTSQKESTCKEKGFEVLHRVGQIGGDEARAVLLTCMDMEKVEKMQNDLRNLASAAEDKFLVLGINDLKENDLWKKLSNHIWGDDWR